MTRDVQDIAMLKRLKDQLKVQQQVSKVHANARVLKELAFYPAHDARKETPEYTRAHKHLTVEMDLPCIVCGVKHSTLGDAKENRYGSKAMETHHHAIEWALANAIDVDKFNKAILPHLRYRHPDRREYAAPFTQKQVADWVDHHEDNLWVLCDVHHRAKFLGIHEITFPIWGPMDLLRADFEQYVQTEVKRAADEAKASKAAAKAAAKAPAAAATAPAAAATPNGKHTNGNGHGKHAAPAAAAAAKPVAKTAKAAKGPKMPPPPKRGVKPRAAARA